MSFQQLSRPVKTYHTSIYDRISPSSSKFNGAGKTILVTGGATGIGLAISKSFAAAVVSRIIIVSRSPGPQSEAKKAIRADFPNVKVETVLAALTDKARMNEIVHATTPDILVLCAGTSHNEVKVLDMPEGDVEETFGTNALGCFNVALAYLKAPAPASGLKTIVDTSSAASHMYMPKLMGYGPSKAALTMMLSHVALEHSPTTDGTRIFSIHPGAILTPMDRSHGFKEGDMPWECENLPADFVVWLASDEADFLHGRFVWAQWDVDELIALKEKMEKDPIFPRLGLVQ